MEHGRLRPDDWPILAPLSFPAVVIDPEGRIAYLNPRAEAFWGVRASDVLGTPARDRLRIGPPDARPWDRWVADVALPAVASAAPIPARTVGADGQPHLVEIRALPAARGEDRYAQLILIERGARVDRAAPPAAVRDPVTGLPQLCEGTAEYVAWNASGGTLVLVDLDALGEVNALFGSPAGDEFLASAGQALGAEAPPGAFAARAGSDELALLLDAASAGDAHAIAERIIQAACRNARAAGLPAGIRAHHGVAAFGRGELAAALRQAGDAVYQRRRALLQARSGGSILLTREGRAAVQEPGGEARAAAPGAYASNFSGDFDSYFRQAYVRAVEQARDFVAFAAPERGSAVIEVGAGSGRITFDGGLAERVGRGGQLLVTDPSSAQLAVARRRAADQGFDWVRFLCAPVEALPVTPGTADLCLGAVFLHFTEPADAIRAMARTVRPGGRVVINAIVDIRWAPTWHEMLQPVYRALEARGLDLDLLVPRTALEEMVQAAGLTVDRAEDVVDVVTYPSPELTLAFWRQTKFVELMLRRLPAEERRVAAQSVADRVIALWDRMPPEDRSFPGVGVNIAAHR